ncbi:MAG: 5-deoxy-glucuronate isomerase, partial [Opitutus sp.]
PPGLHHVLNESEIPINPRSSAALDFAVVRLGAHEVVKDTDAREGAWVLISGSALLTYDQQTVRVARRNVFDEPPTTLHLGPQTPLTIAGGDDGAEFAVVRTENDRRFPSRLFLATEITPEFRGAGLVQGACLRNVRLVFDRAARPDSNLVVGEVVNYPGKWSSYPPHHHDQPEIYHYRFTDARGYGHAEVGEEVAKVRHGDTVFIPPGLDHGQVSAPGYGMYYLWMIRHLPGNPYTGFTFAEEHQWTLDGRQQGWIPKDVPTSTP